MLEMLASCCLTGHRFDMLLRAFLPPPTPRRARRTVGRSRSTDFTGLLLNVRQSCRTRTSNVVSSPAPGQDKGARFLRTWEDVLSCDLRATSAGWVRLKPAAETLNPERVSECRKEEVVGCGGYLIRC